MRSITSGLVVCFLGTVAWTGRLEACWQSFGPRVSIRATSVAGTISSNGKPIAGAVLSLQRFLGRYSVDRNGFTIIRIH